MASLSRSRTHRHPMRVVTRRTGLSAEILRVWERRYRVVTPGRTQTGRRLYSDAEIKRLDLLYRATLGGRSIGLVAGLSDAALAELVRQDAEREPMRGTAAPPPAPRHGLSTQRLVDDALRALERHDAGALGAVLRRALVSLGAIPFLEHVVGVTLAQVGTRWRDGSLRAVHGHLAAGAVRSVLETTIADLAPPEPAPRVLLAALTGQRHEIGALMAGLVAASEGWSVTWLGANLNAADIAEVATRLRARVVAVSLVHPAGDPVVHEELARLRSALPATTAIVVGGSAAPSYTETLSAIGSAPIEHLAAFAQRLGELWSRRSASSRRGGQSRTGTNRS